MHGVYTLDCIMVGTGNDRTTVHELYFAQAESLAVQKLRKLSSIRAILNKK